jgi:hypothetical protein
MSTKGTRKQNSYLSLDKLSSVYLLDTESTKRACYNEYVADQVREISDIILAFLQYEGGDDALFYMQLLWMDDFYKSKKNMVV